MQSYFSFPKACKREKKIFTPEEDKLVNFVVAVFGDRNWDYIATFIKGRTAKQCRDRYMNYLKPGLTNYEWTQSEDELILELYLKYGPKWAYISKYFCNRNQISIKNRYKFLQKSKFTGKTKMENNVPPVEKQKINDCQTEKDDKNVVSSILQNNHDHDEKVINSQEDDYLFNSDYDFDFDENLSSFVYF